MAPCIAARTCFHYLCIWFSAKTVEVNVKCLFWQEFDLVTNWDPLQHGEYFPWLQFSLQSLFLLAHFQPRVLQVALRVDCKWKGENPVEGLDACFETW